MNGTRQLSFDQRPKMRPHNPRAHTDGSEREYLARSGPECFDEGAMEDLLATQRDREREAADLRTIGKRRTHTTGSALVCCLNLGVDPPDVVKPAPCARMHCWFDPEACVSAEEAARAIGDRLQYQYHSWQPRSRYRRLLDPTAAQLQKSVTDLRRIAQVNRVLFHYNGHGVPRPSRNGEIWCFNRSFTEYIPLSLYEVQGWMGVDSQGRMLPSIYVLDCPSAGRVVKSFHELARKRRSNRDALLRGMYSQGGTGGTVTLDRLQELRSSSATGAPIGPATFTGGVASAGHSTGIKQSTEDGKNPRLRPAVPLCDVEEYGDVIFLAACGAEEDLCYNPDLPADLFTSCLLTPVKTALLWFATRTHEGRRLYTIPPRVLSEIPGAQNPNQRDTMFGELHWIFTSLTEAIAYDVLPPHLFRRLFRLDVLVASLFRNFLLAVRIFKSLDIHPVSVPALPSRVAHHPLWRAWDMVVDESLQRLARAAQEGASKQALVRAGAMGVAARVARGPGPAGVARPATASPNPFFEQQLKSFDVWLSNGKPGASKPLQLPIVMQVLLSPSYRARALGLLARFVNIGLVAVRALFQVGLYPYVLKLLHKAPPQLRSSLTAIWCKILMFDRSARSDLLEYDYCGFFVTRLVALTEQLDKKNQGGRRPVAGSAARKRLTFDAKTAAETARLSMSPRRRRRLRSTKAGDDAILFPLESELAMVLFSLASICHRNIRGQYSVLVSLRQSLSVFNTILRTARTALARRWACICVGKIAEHYFAAQQIAIAEGIKTALFEHLSDDCIEVRAAAVYSLGRLVRDENLPDTTAAGESRQRAAGDGKGAGAQRPKRGINLEIGVRVAQLLTDGSLTVRREVALALAQLIWHNRTHFKHAMQVVRERMPPGRAAPGSRARTPSPKPRGAGSGTGAGGSSRRSQQKPRTGSAVLFGGGSRGGVGAALPPRHSREEGSMDAGAAAGLYMASGAVVTPNRRRRQARASFSSPRTKETLTTLRPYAVILSTLTALSHDPDTGVGDIARASRRYVIACVDSPAAPIAAVARMGSRGGTAASSRTLSDASDDRSGFNSPSDASAGGGAGSSPVYVEPRHPVNIALQKGMGLRRFNRFRMRRGGGPGRGGQGGRGRGGRLAAGRGNGGRGRGAAMGAPGRHRDASDWRAQQRVDVQKEMDADERWTVPLSTVFEVAVESFIQPVLLAKAHKAATAGSDAKRRGIPSTASTPAGGATPARTPDRPRSRSRAGDGGAAAPPRGGTTDGPLAPVEAYYRRLCVKDVAEHAYDIVSAYKPTSGYCQLGYLVTEWKNTTACLFHPYEPILVGAGGRDSVGVWEYKSKTLVNRFHNFNPKDSVIDSLEFLNPMQKPLLMTAASNGVVKIWRDVEAKRGQRLAAAWVASANRYSQPGWPYLPNFDHALTHRMFLRNPVTGLMDYPHNLRRAAAATTAPVSSPQSSTSFGGGVSVTAPPPPTPTAPAPPSPRPTPPGSPHLRHVESHGSLASLGSAESPAATGRWTKVSRPNSKPSSLQRGKRRLPCRGLAAKWSQFAGTVATSSPHSRFVRVWDVELALCTAEFFAPHAAGTAQRRGVQSTVSCLHRDRTGNIIFTGHLDGSIHMMDVRQRGAVSRLSPDTKRGHIVDLHLQRGGTAGGLLLAASSNSSVSSFDLRRGAGSARTMRISSGDTLRARLASFAVHDFAPIMAVGSPQREILLANIHSGQVLDSIRYHIGFLEQRIGSVRALAFHPNKILLAAGATDSCLSIYSGDLRDQTKSKLDEKQQRRKE